ncbi:XK-related protein 6 [Cimex lectularius]|uniref:XK-related protein n=1 Tax=Cimex lectularius TaxID=79782 RepID=A0A8I6RN24_CIMLE|nr:XK-related protein 6 [Cimex lectularius]
MENDEGQNASDKGSNDLQQIYRDEVDRLPNRCHVTNWDIFVLMVSVCSHIVDVALDINLAYRYYQKKDYVDFALTATFIYFPSLVNTFISHRMYVLSEDNASSSKMAVKKWTIRIFVLIFQLAPVMRYCDSLDYAMKSRKAERRLDTNEQIRYYELMLKEDGDVALLRVFECFLEAAPQQILQLSIIINRVLYANDESNDSTFTLIHQVGSIASSVLSMAWSMASYHRSIRLCQRDKSNISLTGTAVQFLWHFNITASRILSITAIAYNHPYLTVSACCIHWIVMTFWLALFENTQFVVAESTWRAKISEMFFCGILGLVYIFTYLTPSEGSTRHRYLVYYPICFFENVTAIIIWTIFAEPAIRDSWFYIPMIISGILPFIIGLLFMALFYKLLHPQTSRRVHTAETVRSDVDVQTSSISLAA